MSSGAKSLSPIPYHTEVKEFLKVHEAELWNWMASAEAQAGYAAELRLDLLKSTYRLNLEDHASLNLLADKAKAALGLDIPVTLYQANDPGQNAAIFYLPGEGHVVFSGNLLPLLAEDEILSVLAHELAHYHLWQSHGGEFYIMDRLIRTLAQGPRSSPSHLHTAKNVQLYTEIYCDRASWLACGDISPMVRGLVKLQTGMREVNADSYLRQAREVLGQNPGETKGITHPEAYIRVQALSLWAEDPAAAGEPIRQLIEGSKTVEELDLPGQVRLCHATKILIGELLQPLWFQTPPVLAHARLFFEDFEIRKAEPGEPPVFSRDEKTEEYLNYILLDFSVMDPELEEEPLKEAIRVAQRWGIDNSFAELAKKELKIKARDWEKLVSSGKK